MANRRPAYRPPSAVVGQPQGVIGDFSYYLSVILFFNIVPLIMEFINCLKQTSSWDTVGLIASFRNAWITVERRPELLQSSPFSLPFEVVPPSLPVAFSHALWFRGIQLWIWMNDLQVFLFPQILTPQGGQSKD
jgi:hypothetical protein